MCHMEDFCNINSESMPRFYQRNRSPYTLHASRNWTAVFRGGMSGDRYKSPECTRVVSPRDRMIAPVIPEFEVFWMGGLPSFDIRRLRHALLSRPEDDTGQVTSRSNTATLA